LSAILKALRNPNAETWTCDPFRRGRMARAWGVAWARNFSPRYGKEAEDEERMDYLEFIACVTSHIPPISFVLALRIFRG